MGIFNKQKSDINHKLSSIIPVIYGAVFSYSAYIFSQIILNLVNLFNGPQANSHLGFYLISHYIKMLLIYVVMNIYMVEDIGSIIKIEAKYPYLRTSRYTYEFVIAAFYISAFSLIQNNIYMASLFYTVVVGLGGLWFDHLKKEYLNDINNIDKYARSLRNWHYIAFAILSIELLIYNYIPNTEVWDYISIISFGLTIISWNLISAMYVVYKHGEGMLNYTVNTFLPTIWVKRQTPQSPVK